MAGGNSGRRTGAGPRLQTAAGMGKKKNMFAREKSASRPPGKAA
jgi:hypothetical protein